jgi:hypothetical protein
MLVISKPSITAFRARQDLLVDLDHRPHPLTSSAVMVGSFTTE